MPNINHPRGAAKWPRNLDDLRRDPSGIVFAADIAQLGIIRSYDGLKKLPPPLRVPGQRLAWEARTILIAIGAGLDLPADTAKEDRT